MPAPGDFVAVRAGVALESEVAHINLMLNPDELQGGRSARVQGVRRIEGTSNVSNSAVRRKCPVRPLRTFAMYSWRRSILQRRGRDPSTPWRSPCRLRESRWLDVRCPPGSN